MKRNSRPKANAEKPGTEARGEKNQHHADIIEK
jgi:hypothetical protein